MTKSQYAKKKKKVDAKLLYIPESAPRTTPKNIKGIQSTGNTGSNVAPSTANAMLKMKQARQS